MNSKEEKILSSFSEIEAKLENWGTFVDTKLMEVLSDFIETCIVKIPPRHRVKDKISFLYKALYRKKTYENPILDIEDKIGTRVVVLKSSDVDDVAEKIAESSFWISKTTRDIRREIEDSPKLFDYQSVHIVVSPTNETADYPDEIKPLLTCEIQIRTLLQHAFAEISHDSTYKGPYKNDREIIRSLSKSMALMEATDDYFCNIFGITSVSLNKILQL